MKKLHWIELQAENISGILVAVLGLVICATIVGRSFLGSGVPDDVVFVAELMVVSMTLPLGAAIARDELISIDMVVKRLPDRPRKTLIRLGFAIGIIAIAPVAFGAIQGFLHAWDRGTYYDGVLYVSAWPGKLLFALAMLLALIRTIGVVVLGVDRGLHLETSVEF